MNRIKRLGLAAVVLAMALGITLPVTAAERSDEPEMQREAPFKLHRYQIPYRKHRPKFRPQSAPLPEARMTRRWVPSLPQSGHDYLADFQNRR